MHYLLTINLTPKPPVWNTSNNPSRQWRSQGNTFARYFLTLFKPWDINTGTISSPLTWGQFGVFMDQLEHPQEGNRVASFINRNISQLIYNISGNLRVNTKHKSILTQYRTRDATQWNSAIADFADVCDGRLGNGPTKRPDRWVALAFSFFNDIRFDQHSSSWLLAS